MMSAGQRTTTVITIITPFIIGFSSYVYHLKQDNLKLQLDYVKRENSQVSSVMLDISKKLDNMYNLMNDNNTAIKLLSEKVDRNEEDISILKSGGQLWK